MSQHDAAAIRGLNRVDYYTRREVVELNSLTREQAIDRAVGTRDSLQGLSDSDSALHVKRGAEDAAVPFLARWSEVRRARDEIEAAKEGMAILQLRAAGFPEAEIARLMNRDRLAVRRRQRVAIDEILAALGGEAPDVAPVIANPDACLKCGQAPRVRLREVATRVRGGWRVDQPERQASVCYRCLAPDLHYRVMREGMRAA